MHVIVQIRVAEEYFSVVLFITVYKMVLPFESVDEKCESTNQTKAIERQFPVALFIILYKVVSSVESGDEILKESSLTVLFSAQPSLKNVSFF